MFLRFERITSMIDFINQRHSCSKSIFAEIFVFFFFSA